MSKRIFGILSILVIAAMLLAACAIGENTPAAPVEGGNTGGETTGGETTGGETTGGVPAECAENADERQCAVFAPGETVKIGFAGPMTGDYSAFGTDISQGGQVAIDDAGDVEGWEIEMLVEDTQGSGEGGASVANLYASNPDVVAISGHTFSGSAAAAIPIYNQARLPMLSASATRADLTQGDQDVFNRIPFTDDIQGTSAAEYLYNTLGIRRLAVMHDGDAYGQGLADKVAQVFVELGGEVVANQAVTAGETDYTAPLTEIGAQNPEAIYYGGYYAEAAVIASNMPVAGLQDAILFSDDGTFGATFIELAGPNADGAYASSALPPASEAVDTFTGSYQEQYGSAPGELSTFTWHGYDVVSALVSVIKQVAIVGEDGNLYIPREAMVEGVRNLSGYQGLTGEISCNAEGECNTAGPTFFMVEDGEWVQAGQ